MLRTTVRDLYTIGRWKCAQDLEKWASDTLLDGLFITPPPIKHWPKSLDFWKCSLSERREAYEFYRRSIPPDIPEDFQVWCDHLAGRSRVSEWEWRVGQWITERHRAGWYGIFATVTIDPKIYDPETVMRDNRHWKTYLDHWRREICRACGERQRHKGGPHESAYIQYAGCLEHGKSKNHHHIHVLFFMRDIPSRWKKDPNLGLISPINYQIMEPKAWWPFGTIQEVSPLRYLGDRWTREGWIMPQREKLVLRAPYACGYYIAKYLDKEHKQWNHKIKTTRGCGVDDLRSLLMTMDEPLLDDLTKRPATWETMRVLCESGGPPPHLIARIAKQEIFRVRMESGLRGCREIQQRPSVFPKMLASVNDGLKPWLMRSKERYAWVAACGAEVARCSNPHLYVAHFYGEVPRGRVEPVAGMLQRW